MTGSVFELGDVGEPFFVGGLGDKIASEDVRWQLHEWGGVRSGLFCADDSAKIADLGESVEALFVVVGVVDGVVFVGESAIAVDAAIGLVEKAHFVEDVSVFALTGGWGAVEPMVISGAADGKCLTDPGDGVTELRHILDDDIFQFMAHAGQSHLLSRSRSFFNASTSVSRRVILSWRILFSYSARSRGSMRAGSRCRPRPSRRPSSP